MDQSWKSPLPVVCGFALLLALVFTVSYATGSALRPDAPATPVPTASSETGDMGSTDGMDGMEGMEGTDGMGH
ncbi:hypothetical protein ABZ490_02795 [Streptomyces sp. NPDC005811]|uniref:hypothetical protein n=1 Tax=Streptomyces sp. NPDC005811 TaxID=3154565 RepID=UPI0033DB04B1